MPVCDPPALEGLATSVLASIERPIEVDGLDVLISASIGRATWSDDDHDADGLIDRADAAAYRAKADGTARVFSADSAALVSVPVDT
jgi:GGDEF domain-containing protein